MIRLFNTGNDVSAGAAMQTELSKPPQVRRCISLSLHLLAPSCCISLLQLQLRPLSLPLPCSPPLPTGTGFLYRYLDLPQLPWSRASPRALNGSSVMGNAAFSAVGASLSRVVTLLS